MSEGNRTACAAAHNETYVFYPDDTPLHSLALKGDSRAALVPFMAHRCAPSSVLLTCCATHSARCWSQLQAFSKQMGRAYMPRGSSSCRVDGYSMMQRLWQKLWLFRHFGGSYKWLLYGDDDTFFFLDAAMNVLQHLDPEMPYFLTGGAAVPGQY